MSFDIGATIAGKYRIERVLGQGGMGTVYLARHLLLDSNVAIKLLRFEEGQKRAATERLIREGRALARLRGKHIARVLDVEASEEGPCFLVLEYLEGEDLGSIVARSGPLPIDVALSYVLQICEALAEAHAQGIVHRDIKPSNLFLTSLSDGTRGIKVIDFGISKDTETSAALTHSRAIIGSPRYMAPEQMRAGANVDARSDIWALGVVLFELLTGKVPYHGDSVLQICASILESPPPSPKALRPDVPDVIDRLVKRCLARDPARRLANVAELAHGIVQFAEGSTGRLTWILPREALVSTRTTAEPIALPNDAATGAPGVTQAEHRAQRSWRRPILGLYVIVLIIAGGAAFALSGAGTAPRSSAEAAPVAPTRAPERIATAPAAPTGAIHAAPAQPAVKAADPGPSRATPTGPAAVAAVPGTSPDAPAGPSMVAAISGTSRDVPATPTGVEVTDTALLPLPVDPGKTKSASKQPIQGRTVLPREAVQSAGAKPDRSSTRPGSGTHSDPVLEYGHY